MIRCLASGLCLTLAACDAKDRATNPLNDSLPGQVVAQLPLSVDLNSVSRDVNGCFFYRQGGQIFLVKNEAGQPMCFPVEQG